MRWSIVMVVALAAGVSGCSGGDTLHGPDGVVCTANYVFGLSVIVQDKASGQRICDAEVVALAGSYQETLRADASSEFCSYSGAGERPDVYELRASKAGFRLATVAAVRVVADECHVTPVRVTVQLER